jgi:hypothetical protein
MLTHYRNKCNSWPDRYFPTFKEWIEYIDEIIDLLEFAETDPEELNDYTETFHEACRRKYEGDEPADYDEILDRYYNEIRSIYERQTAARQRALGMFATYADDIWW